MKYQKKSFWRRMILSAGIMIGIIVAEISVRADEIQLPDVVVTSSRLERPVDGTPGFVSIIRASDLSRYMSSISESLTLAAGTNPLSYGSAGSLTWSSLRCSTTDQVLTLLDGVRMNNAQGGGFNLGSMSSASIERIEDSPLDQVVVTNTIPLNGKADKCPKIVVLSIAELLGETIKRIDTSHSVSTLFV